MSARWSSEQEATLLARMGQGATVEQVAGELGKSVINVEMKWSMIRPVVFEEAEEAEEAEVAEVAKEAKEAEDAEEAEDAVPAVVVDYSAELQAIKAALVALEAKLAAQKR